jgi:hypothetical protein
MNLSVLPASCRQKKLGPADETSAGRCIHGTRDLHRASGLRAVRRHLHQHHREMVDRAISEVQQASKEKSHQSKRPRERQKE